MHKANHGAPASMHESKCIHTDRASSAMPCRRPTASSAMRDAAVPTSAPQPPDDAVWAPLVAAFLGDDLLALAVARSSLRCVAHFQKYMVQTAECRWTSGCCYVCARALCTATCSGTPTVPWRPSLCSNTRARRHVARVARTHGRPMSTSSSVLLAARCPPPRSSPTCWVRRETFATRTMPRCRTSSGTAEGPCEASPLARASASTLSRPVHGLRMALSRNAAPSLVGVLRRPPPPVRIQRST